MGPAPPQATGSPYLKFAGASIASLLLVVIAAIQQGTFDGPAFELGFMGLVASSLTFWAANANRGIARYAKALYPAGLTVIAILVHYVVSGGELNATDLRMAIAGGLTALVALVLPNATSPAR